MRRKARSSHRARFRPVSRDRVNSNGSAIAIGQPFAATGARDLRPKKLFVMPKRSRAIVSVCAEGGQGVVTMLERPQKSLRLDTEVSTYTFVQSLRITATAVIPPGS